MGSRFEKYSFTRFVSTGKVISYELKQTTIIGRLWSGLVPSLIRYGHRRGYCPHCRHLRHVIVE